MKRLFNPNGRGCIYQSKVYRVYITSKASDLAACRESHSDAAMWRVAHELLEARYGVRSSQGPSRRGPVVGRRMVSVATGSYSHSHQKWVQLIEEAMLHGSSFQLLDHAHCHTTRRIHCPRPQPTTTWSAT